MNLITTVVLVALAAVWLWVLGRPLLMTFLNAARRDPVGNFNKKMSVLAEAPQRSLAQSGPIGGFRPNAGSSVRRRRLTIFMALAICVVVSAILAIAFRGLFVWNMAIFLAAFAGYTLLAARAGAAESERASKVAFIDPGRPTSALQIKAVAER